MSVLYRNLNRWTDLDEIWHGGGPRGGNVMGGGFNQVPSTPGCVWSLSCAFLQKLYETKVVGHPQFSGVGLLFGPLIRIWKDLGPMSFCSHGHSLWTEVHKTNVVVYDPNSYLVRLDTLYPDPQGPGGPKGGPVGFWSLSSAFCRKLYKTKVAGYHSIPTPNNPELYKIFCLIKVALTSQVMLTANYNGSYKTPPQFKFKISRCGSV